MGTPCLKIPSEEFVWTSQDEELTVFITREADSRYYVWVRSPDMVKYGYTSGYAWTFSVGNKTDAFQRAQRELEWVRSKKGSP